jgi:hypothetical protein
VNFLSFRRAVLLGLGAVVWAIEPAAAQDSAGVEVMIPLAPEPARGKFESILVYELHLTNFTSYSFRLDRVEILAENGAQAASLIGSYHGDELSGAMAHPGLPAEPADRQVIGGGVRAIVYVWLVIKDGTPLPGALKHRFFSSFLNSETGRVETGILETPPVTVRKPRPLVRRKLDLGTAGHSPRSSRQSRHRSSHRAARPDDRAPRGVSLRGPARRQRSGSDRNIAPALARVSSVNVESQEAAASVMRPA